MDMTTVAAVKVIRNRPATDVNDDAKIGVLITAVSDVSERLMNRHAQNLRRTEVYKLRPGQSILWLRGFPITSVQSVKYGSSRVFSAVTAFLSTAYDLIAETGQLDFGRAITSWNNPGYVEVTYEGGMGVDTDTFVAAYPEIAMAVGNEVVNRFNRSATPQGNLQAFGTGVAYEKELSTLKDLESVVLSNRRNLL